MSFSKLQIKAIVITASLLMLVAALGAALVGMTFSETKDAIKHNEELTLLRKLNNIIPAETYDNDLLLDTIVIKPSFLLNTKQDTLVYRARKNNRNVAAVFTSIAPNGYNGSIQLLVGVKTNGQLSGVRVVKHRETPGLGDYVDIAHSNWIRGFTGKSLSEPNEFGWKVKRDGGIFDQFTGATITPRATVKAIHNALLYFENNQAILFSKPIAATNMKTSSKTTDTTSKPVEKP